MQNDEVYDEEEEMIAATPLPTTPPPAAAAEPEEKIDVLDLDEVLAFTQKKRMRVVTEVNKKLHNLEDPGMINVMLKGLSDMDKAVVQRRRVGIDEKAASSQDELARNSAEILRAMSGKAFMQVPRGEAPTREAPKLDEDEAKVDLVPGETVIGTPSLDYENFMKEKEGKA